MNPNTEPILDAANKFLWSDGMQESMDGFATNYAELFVGVRKKIGQELDGEQRLEWTTAHNEFSQLFEFHLEQFLETQPFSTEDFVAACQDALNHGSWDDAGRTVQVVLSMVDYDNFVALMIDKAEEQALESAMWAAGAASDEEEAAPAADRNEPSGGGYDDGYGGGGGGGGEQQYDSRADDGYGERPAAAYDDAGGLE